MGKKKKKEILDKEYAGFAQGMNDNGYSAAAVKAPRLFQDRFGRPSTRVRQVMRRH